MWKLANTNFPGDRPLIAHGESVALRHVEAAVACLLEKQKTVAEGAGACGLAAAMFGQRALEYDRAVAVVCGGCIDNELLAEILRNVDDSNSRCGRGGGDRYLNHASFKGEPLLRELGSTEIKAKIYPVSRNATQCCACRSQTSRPRTCLDVHRVTVVVLTLTYLLFRHVAPPAKPILPDFLLPKHTQAGSGTT